MSLITSKKPIASDNSHNLNLVVKGLRGYSFNQTLFSWSTGNCQILTISPLCDALSYLEDDELKAFFKEAININKHDQKMGLFDVKQGAQFEKIKRVFKINIATPYTSTNGSKMIMGLFYIDFN